MDSGIRQTELMRRVREGLQKKPVNAILGPRRSGKIILAQNLGIKFWAVAIFWAGLLHGVSQGVEGVAQKRVIPLKQTEMVVEGVVFDSASGHPLQEFTVSIGSKYRKDAAFQWSVPKVHFGSNGHFRTVIRKSKQETVVVAESKGFKPMQFALEEGDTNRFAFSLEPFTNGIGTLLNPDGTAAAGVRVYMTTLERGVFVNTNIFVPNDTISRASYVETAADGTFAVRLKVDAYGLIALNSNGYAEVTMDKFFANDAKLTLQSWATIKGRLMIGDKPQAGEEIRANLAHIPGRYYPRHLGPLTFFLKTRTDESGNFEFTKIPPLAVEVFHAPPYYAAGVPGKSVRAGHVHRFFAKPGENHEIQLGGSGRRVTGQIEVKGYSGEIAWSASQLSLQSVPPNNHLKALMADVYKKLGKLEAAAKTKEEKTAVRTKANDLYIEYERARGKYYSTPEGIQDFLNSRSYGVKVSDDGSFVAEDILPGSYNFQITILEMPVSDISKNMQHPRVAALNRQINVPIQEGEDNAQYDAGTFTLSARQKGQKKTAAPDFTAKTIDGKSVSLADYRGKYLLLDFWAVWCGPCLDETPHLKAAYDAFGKHPNFAMLGLNLDANTDEPWKYTRTNNLEWTQGFLGDWSKTDLPANFGVSGIPAIFLIGPDGQILERNLRGPYIKAAIERALGSEK